MRVFSNAFSVISPELPARVCEAVVHGVVFCVQIQSIFSTFGQLDVKNNLSVFVAVDDVLA